MNEAVEDRWNVATRIAFRFVFSYLVLYILPFPFNLIPSAGDFLSAQYRALWRMIVVPVAQRFFGIEIAVFTSGSGDKTYDYVRLLVMVVIAAAITLLWSILDRRRLHYTQLHEWLRVYVRFALLTAMVTYGASKILPGQFGSLSLDRLVQRFGDASPMGLLWTFMSASMAYQVFTGLGEMIGGLLLATRRTTLLGALVTIAVMANVVALNFCYDVPVKLYSSHLLAMAVFLVLPDARRLLQTFFLHRPRPLTDVKWLRIGGLVLRTVAVLYIVVTMLQESYFYGLDDAFRSPLRGIWNVGTLTINGIDQPLTDAIRWRRIVLDYPEQLVVETMNDDRERYWATLDEKNRTMELMQRQATKKKSGTLTYHRPDSRSLVLDGTLSGQTYHATLHKEEERSFLLTSRGFHWINEYPFNR